MKNKILLVVVVVLGIIYVYIRSFVKETPFYVNNELVIKNTETNVIENVFMEDYLVGVLAGEMPASFDIEALKAQAVASRTYAYYKKNTSNKDYDLTTDKSTQVYLTVDEIKQKWGVEYEYYLNKIKEAILSTKDLVVTFQGEIISAYYFSMSNGYTENATSVFGEDKSYLTSVSSKEDTSNKNFNVNISLNKQDFCQKLSINCEKIEIKNVIKNDTERVERITINNKVYSGTEVRKLLNLRSTDFNILVNDNIIEINTNGYGHGVGMSQYGANQMAKEGYSYQEILKHYYTGVEITSINSIK